MIEAPHPQTVPQFEPNAGMRSLPERAAHLGASAAQLAERAHLMAMSLSKQAEHIRTAHAAQSDDLAAAVKEATKAFRAAGSVGAAVKAWQDYALDAVQRSVLVADTMRERGDIFIEHEAAGNPPVLVYDYEIVVDGADLTRPSNYFLMRIKAPDGIETDDTKRPYIIIDPRAGHGAGIGGFKQDSQVGVALRQGHPVYFVGFRRRPEPTQTLADVTTAEATFVREVRRRHPQAPAPAVTGNCQGGWATLLLAAMNPDLTGPIILNGAPVDTWAGTVGRNPMRYNGGILGGVINPMLLGDLGNGIFDGAHIVGNFEQLNPSRNYFGKYYDLFTQIDTERERFLEFERWWGGYYLLNEPEMRWIVEELFVGNKLVKGEARLETGRKIDVKNIRSPIIVFASRGDNITPPQQALNWIVKSYANTREIEIRGQRIIYMIHEQVGHLGIFVSGAVAAKEHNEVTSTLQTIESLAPGLYEMKIEDYEGPVEDRRFSVSFHNRSLEDLKQIDDGVDDEAPFAAVSRMSEQVGEVYDTMLRPLVQSMVTEQGAELARKMHPARLQRALFSSRNPAVAPLATFAEDVRARRAPADPENPFLKMQEVWAKGMVQSLDLCRDLRDMGCEAMFYGLWATPWARWYGKRWEEGRTLKRQEELRALPAVEALLGQIEDGGFAEAVIRMLVLLAESRGNVRRDRLERSAQVLTQDEPFASLAPEKRQAIVDQQTVIVQFERTRAIRTLPRLLKTYRERELAAAVAQYVPGLIEEMAPQTLKMLTVFHHVLGLPKIAGDITRDPLAGTAYAEAVAEAQRPVNEMVQPELTTGDVAERAFSEEPQWTDPAPVQFDPMDDTASMAPSAEPMDNGFQPAPELPVAGPAYAAPDGNGMTGAEVPFTPLDGMSNGLDQPPMQDDFGGKGTMSDQSDFVQNGLSGPGPMYKTDDLQGNGQYTDPNGAAPQQAFDAYGNPLPPQYDEYGNLITTDPNTQS